MTVSYREANNRNKRGMMIKAAYKEVEAARDNQNRIWGIIRRIRLDRFIVTQCRFGTSCAGAFACKRMEAAGATERLIMMQVAKADQNAAPQARIRKAHPPRRAPRTESIGQGRKERNIRGNTSSGETVPNGRNPNAHLRTGDQATPDGRWGEPPTAGVERGVLGCTYRIGPSIQIDAGGSAQGRRTRTGR